MNRTEFAKRYRFAANILWRRENDDLFLLDPLRRRVLKLRADLANAVGPDGTVMAEEPIRSAVEALAGQGVLEPDDSPHLAKRTTNTGPFNVTIQITEACNLRCGHCHNDRESPSKMTLSRFEDLVHELREMSVFSVNISGGEPTLHSGIVQMIRDVDALGMQVTMSTNASMLSEDLVSRLAGAGLHRVQISLDAASAEKHDAARGAKGSFDRMLRGITCLQHHGIEYMFVTTLTNQTVREYEDTIDLAFKWRASAHKTNTVVPQGRAKELPLLNPIALRPYVDAWRRQKLKYAGRFPVLAETMFRLQMPRIQPIGARPTLEYGCPAGVLTCGIKPNGDVIPCSFFPDLVIGNAFERGFGVVWTESGVLCQLRSQISDTVMTRSCAASFWGCRARAYVLAGDFRSPDPFCPEMLCHDGNSLG